MYFIGILADIKQAFLNVEISKEDIDFLRFLLFDEDSGEVWICRFLRVLFGLTPSPFRLNGSDKHRLALCYENVVVQKSREDLYVDDVTSGCDTVDEGVSFHDDAKAIMAGAGFELRNGLQTMLICRNILTLIMPK